MTSFSFKHPVREFWGHSINFPYSNAPLGIPGTLYQTPHRLLLFRLRPPPGRGQSAVDGTLGIGDPVG